ncbi:MAG: Nicotinamidase, partial [uncultured Thermomicrobiales bacterium]
VYRPTCPRRRSGLDRRLAAGAPNAITGRTGPRPGHRGRLLHRHDPRLPHDREPGVGAGRHPGGAGRGALPPRPRPRRPPLRPAPGQPRPADAGVRRLAGARGARDARVDDDPRAARPPLRRRLRRDREELAQSRDRDRARRLARRAPGDPDRPRRRRLHGSVRLPTGDAPAPPGQCPQPGRLPGRRPRRRRRDLRPAIRGGGRDGRLRPPRRLFPRGLPVPHGLERDRRRPDADVV